MSDPLTDAEREALLAVEIAYDNMHSDWAQEIVFAVVARIVAARVALAEAREEKAHRLYADTYQKWMIAAHPWCVCEEGPYFGAQLAGTPLRCERCRRDETHDTKGEA